MLIPITYSSISLSYMCYLEQKVYDFIIISLPNMVEYVSTFWGREQEEKLMSLLWACLQVI